ncbi:hypothetical protein [Microseira wollei]|uniref:hypothetical protein n=1 Tax=Microseira wollei TaxID=467598 RepID=UPI001CFEE0FD|nr:hypothetical protein [Microseira wollei]
MTPVARPGTGKVKSPKIHPLPRHTPLHRTTAGTRFAASNLAKLPSRRHLSRCRDGGSWQNRTGD